MATFTLRAVVREEGGSAGVILGKWALKAQHLSEAKAEADRARWDTDGVAPNAFETLDGSGAVVAKRSYIGRDHHAPWS